MQHTHVEERSVTDAANRIAAAGALASTAIVPCNPALLSLAGSRSVLLLQGPLGPFFDRLAGWLQSVGALVNRVAFQGGDALDCQAVQPILYTDTLKAWPAAFREMVAAHRVDHIVLFGQSRFYHQLAIREAHKLGVKVVVMEEGYFRPGFATMELNGVNGYSTTLDCYHWQPTPSSAHPHLGSGVAAALLPHHCGGHFQKMAWHASQHYLALWHQQGRFPNYKHHKENNPYWYARFWVWSWVKKLWFRQLDRRTQRKLLAGPQPYFFVPLQHDGDAQITHHSSFNENTEFIFQVLRSFASHAPAQAQLVFRQHPHSRGGSGHSGFIHSLAEELNIGHRVLHLTEGDTPDLCQHSAGVVLINSTVGLQALERGAPLMVLGEAMYNQPDIAFQGTLDQFWQQPTPPAPAATQAFMAQLKNLTQVPVSLYAMRNQPLAWATQKPVAH